MTRIVIAAVAQRPSPVINLEERSAGITQRREMVEQAVV